MKKLIGLISLIFIISLVGLSGAALHLPAQPPVVSSADFKAKSLLIVEAESDDKISYDDAMNDASVRKIDFSNYTAADYENAPKTNYIKEFFSGIKSICISVINGVSSFWNDYVVAMFLLWQSFLMF